MKNSIILIITGFIFIAGALLQPDTCIFNRWFVLVPIGGFVVFISGTIKFIKKLEHENY